MQQLVSIIIPAFNAERYFDECLQSVRGQTHDNLEIIIVNDGSTDGTYAIAERHAAEDGRIRLLQQANAGVSAARNRGTEASSGAFVCFFDADDVMYPRSVELRVEALEREECDVVFANHLVVDADRRPMRVSQGVPLGERPILKLLESPSMGATDTMLRRSALDRVGRFRVGQSHLEDWDLWIRCGLAGLTFVHVDEIIDEYRQHGSSACRAYEKTLAQGMEMLDRYRPARGDHEAMRAWRQGRFGLRRGWLWTLWDEPRPVSWKLARIARRAAIDPPMAVAFARVAWGSLRKSASGARVRATPSQGAAAPVTS